MVGKIGKMFGWMIVLFLILSFLLMMPNTESATTVSLYAGEVTDNSVLLHWSESGDWFFSRYDVSMGDGSGWNVIYIITNISVTSYNVTGLSPSTTYRFKITDHDSFGSADSNIINVTTKSSTIFGKDYTFVLYLVFALIAFIIIVAIILIAIKGRNRKTYPRERIMKRPIEPAEEQIISLKVCPYCGTKNEGTAYCSNCGKKL